MIELTLDEKLIEKRAQELLVEAKQPIEEGCAILQLMAWRMAQEPRVFRKWERQGDVSEALESFWALPAAVVIRFVTTNEDGDPMLFPSDFDGLSPVDAAEMLLAELEFQMRVVDM